MTLFRLVDRAAFVSGLSQRLRGAGVEVGLSASARFGQALAVWLPNDTMALYWTARTCLLHDIGDLARFDAVFWAVFGDDEVPVAPGRRESSRVVIKSTGTVTRRSDSVDATSGRRLAANHGVIVDDDRPEKTEDDETVLPELLPSALAELADVPFDELSDQEVDQLSVWFDDLVPTLPLKRRRRYQSSTRAGAIDLRRTIRAARTTGGEPIRLLRRRPVYEPRRIVLVADLSGSMLRYSRIYLHLMRSLVLSSHAEAFVFSTSLRRVTVPLRGRDSKTVVDELDELVDDRFGGTRIATCLGELIDSSIWSNLLRGAVVVIVSDGWDADAPSDLQRRMQRLSRLTHRLIWVNPRVAAPGFEPLAGGMAAAVPSVDRLLSGHTIRDLFAVVASLGDADG
ncbi:MAG: VWA domain-containing protein [Actinobacteria bacterium]|nr:VWA domain-containing protein [Actinomycetota bacterium]